MKEEFGRMQKIIERFSNFAPKDFICSQSFKYFFGHTPEGVGFRFYTPSDNFLILQTNPEDLKIVAVLAKILECWPSYCYLDKSEFSHF